MVPCANADGKNAFITIGKIKKRLLFKLQKNGGKSSDLICFTSIVWCCAMLKTIISTKYLCNDGGK